MDGVESFGLRFCDWWDVGAAFLLVVAGEVTSRVLDDYVAVLVIE